MYPAPSLNLTKLTFTIKQGTGNWSLKLNHKVQMNPSVDPQEEMRKRALKIRESCCSWLIVLLLNGLWLYGLGGHWKRIAISHFSSDVTLLYQIPPFLPEWSMSPVWNMYLKSRYQNWHCLQAILFSSYLEAHSFFSLFPNLVSPSFLVA